jgi:hypothetical protein
LGVLNKTLGLALGLWLPIDKKRPTVAVFLVFHAHMNSSTEIHQEPQISFLQISLNLATATENWYQTSNSFPALSAKMLGKNCLNFSISQMA